MSARCFHARLDPGKRGFVDRPTVIVGEGPKSKEWVASNDAVENPTVAPLLYDLDRAQKAGAIRSFDLKKWFVTKFPGLESGGAISASARSRSDSMPSQPGARQDLSSGAMDRLCSVLEHLEKKGIPAFVALDDLDAEQKIRNMSRNIAKKE